MNNPAIKGEVSKIKKPKKKMLIINLLERFPNQNMTITKNIYVVAQYNSRGYKLTELNLREDGDSSPNLKVRVSSPLM